MRRTNNKYVRKPNFVKALLIRTGIMFLVGAVVFAFIYNYYDKKREVKLGEAENLKVLEIEMALSNLNFDGNTDAMHWLNIYTECAPYYTGKFIEIYEGDELISSTKSALVTFDGYYSIGYPNYVPMSGFTNTQPSMYMNYDEEAINDYLQNFDDSTFFGFDSVFHGDYYLNSLNSYISPKSDASMAMTYGYKSETLDPDTGVFHDTLSSLHPQKYDEAMDEHKMREYVISYFDRTPTAKDFENGTTVNYGVLDSNNVTHNYEIRFSDYIYMRNLFDNTGIVMYLVLLMIFVPCFLLALAWALISYLRHKNIYTVYAYRTNLTNKLAHDLKTPLMAITSYAETYKGSSSEEKKEHYVDKIYESANYMNSIISKTLDLAKIESGSSKDAKESFDIKDIVDEIRALVEKDTAENNLKFDTSEVASNIIKTDRILFKNAVCCLIENAVKYAPSGSVIEVKSGSGDILSVTNDYKGEIDNIESLKEAFVRGEKSRTTKGSGLGLTIANEGLRNLGYKLDLDYKESKFTASVK